MDSMVQTKSSSNNNDFGQLIVFPDVHVNCNIVSSSHAVEYISHYVNGPPLQLNERQSIEDVNDVNSEELPDLAYDSQSEDLNNPIIG